MSPFCILSQLGEKNLFPRSETPRIMDEQAELPTNQIAPQNQLPPEIPARWAPQSG